MANTHTAPPTLENPHTIRLSLEHTDNVLALYFAAAACRAAYHANRHDMVARRTYLEAHRRWEYAVRQAARKAALEDSE